LAVFAAADLTARSGEIVALKTRGYADKESSPLLLHHQRVDLPKGSDKLVKMRARFHFQYYQASLGRISRLADMVGDGIYDHYS
jgi:hypothetical protein